MKQLWEEAVYHNHRVQQFREGDRQWWIAGDCERECGSLAEAIHVAKARSAIQQLDEYRVDVLDILPTAAPQGEDAPQDEETNTCC